MCTNGVSSYVALSISTESGGLHWLHAVVYWTTGRDVADAWIATDAQSAHLHGHVASGEKEKDVYSTAIAQAIMHIQCWEIGPYCDIALSHST
jgi:hypothetical protein